MSEYHITCVRLDTEGRTTHLGIGYSRKIVPVEEVIIDIKNSRNLYYTAINNDLVLVRIKTRDGNDYLTTVQDESEPNNLDNLPSCP